MLFCIIGAVSVFCFYRKVVCSVIQAFLILILEVRRFVVGICCFPAENPSATVRQAVVGLCVNTTYTPTRRTRGRVWTASFPAYPSRTHPALTTPLDTILRITPTRDRDRDRGRDRVSMMDDRYFSDGRAQIATRARKTTNHSLHTHYTNIP
jgi:hypothetical protein